MVCDYCGVGAITVSLYFTEGKSVLKKDLVADDRAATVIGLCPPDPNFRFSHDCEAETWHLLRNGGSSDVNRWTETSGPAILVSNAVSERIHDVGGQATLCIGSEKTVRYFSYQRNVVWICSTTVELKIVT